MQTKDKSATKRIVEDVDGGGVHNAASTHPVDPINNGVPTTPDGGPGEASPPPKTRSVHPGWLVYPALGYDLSEPPPQTLDPGGLPDTVRHFTQRLAIYMAHKQQAKSEPASVDLSARIVRMTIVCSLIVTAIPALISYIKYNVGLLKDTPASDAAPGEPPSNTQH